MGTSAIMDYDQYIQEYKKGGLFSLLFKNVNGLDVAQIKQVFSQFGRVTQVVCTGNDTGFRFVRYEKYNHARGALEALLDNSNFKFTVPRNKNPDTVYSSPKNKTNDKNVKKEEFDDFDESWDEKKYAGPVWEHECKESGQGSSASFQSKTDNGNSFNSDKKNQKNFYVKNRQSKNNFGDRNSKSHADAKASNEKDDFGNKNSYNHGTDRNSQNFQKSKNQNSSQSYVNKSKNDNSEIDHSKRKSNTNVNTNQKISAGNRKSIDSALNSKTNETTNEEIPDLVSISSKSSKQLIVDAQDVVVGNIPLEYGAAYILHLFERLKPLAISQIKKEPKTNIRYCLVYFKSVEDSANAEILFDKYSLDGVKLVVLRPSKLIKEAA